MRSIGYSRELTEHRLQIQFVMANESEVCVVQYLVDRQGRFSHSQTVFLAVEDVEKLKAFINGEQANGNKV